MTTEERIKNIYTKTNGGLDIIRSIYPQINELNNLKKPFKIRSEERTPSATIKEISGKYLVCDWGGSGRAKDAISAYAEENGIDRWEAIKALYTRYVGKIEQEKPAISFEEKKDTDIEGEITWEEGDFTDADLKTWGLHVRKEHLRKYGWIKIASYRKVGKDKVIVKSSTPSHPIYARKCGKGDKESPFYKFYAPMEENKNYRFFYYPNGGKPADYINGFAELQKEREENGGDSSDITACICSGERDSMCCYSMGILPIWLNSETAKLKPSTVKILANYCNALYLLPDIDDTGRKVATQLSLQYPQLRVIYLPDDLLEHKDWRGNDMKDFRDWVSLGHTSTDFYNLRKIAKSSKFITRIDKENGDIAYNINPSNLLYWLELHGFGIYQLSDNNTELIQIRDGIINTVTSNQIRMFIKTQMEKDYYFQEEVNTILKSKMLGDSLFSLLKPIVPQTTDSRLTHEELAFINTTVVVSPETVSIEASQKTQILQSYLIPHDFNYKPSPFMVAPFTEDSDYSIQIHHTKSLYFQLCIETSRIHWRKEQERLGLSEKSFQKDYRCRIESKQLTALENREQIQCLLNKMFVIGYLASRYKNPAKPYAVYACDNLVMGSLDCNGRSGKSLFFKYLQIMCRQAFINGRQKRLTENQFLYEAVVPGTNHVRIEDLDVKVDLDFFYTDIADTLYINKKGKGSFCLDYAASPKFIFTSNYVPLDINPSTQGRLVYCTFSDWYHQKSPKNTYETTLGASDEFARNLPDREELPYDYTQEDYDNDVSFIIACIQFYQRCSLQGVKFNPPMENMNVRRDNILMGERFIDWADMYFSKEGCINQELDKQQTFLQFCAYTNSRSTSNYFTRSLKIYARTRGLHYNGCLNPDEAERIIKRDPQTRQPREYFIISDH